jgi:hypothetical protein
MLTVKWLLLSWLSNRNSNKAKWAMTSNKDVGSFWKGDTRCQSVRWMACLVIVAKNNLFATIIATSLRLVKTQDTKETSQHFRHAHATDLFESRRRNFVLQASHANVSSIDWFQEFGFQNSVKLTIHKINLLASQISVWYNYFFHEIHIHTKIDSQTTSLQTM